ncbi:MAG: polyprenyl synthetase family protein [Phycisphaerales bacterium]|nr:polyprenyl synthetase family protein [Phycisphaerales bacterium]
MKMETVVDLNTPIASSLEQVLECFDRELRSDLPFVNRLTAQVRRYRGKLLRPKLLLMAGRLTGELCHDHVVLAAVVEMVHMATLVHDDVLDNADVRRRQETINRLIGNEGAVLLGDYLISHAYHLCSSLGSTHASRRIAAATNTVCEGELMQIENRGNLELTESDYLEIIRRKTASLTSLCCELGAKVSGADDEIVEHLAAYGLEIGMAFQIVDDLLDLTATESETGKTVGRDADLGILTLPLIRFMAEASTSDRTKLAEVLSNGHPQKTEQVRAMIGDSSYLDEAMGVARSYVQSAIMHLNNLPDNDAKTSLITTAEFVIQRRQ